MDNNSLDRILIPNVLRFDIRQLIGLAVGLLLGCSGLDTPNETLDIYWIDVEGGAATLIVTPARESILVDAGWNRDDGRDAIRIQAAMMDAGITRIDYFIASHYHDDHIGGVPELSARAPIGQFIDHGDRVEGDPDSSRRVWEAYLSTAKGKRRTVKPGDTLPLAGMALMFVTSAERVLSRTGGQTPNAHCQGTPPGSDSPGENSHSIGYLVSFAGFEFLDLGDLTVNIQHELACPENPVGAIDLFQVPHHGDGVAPQLIGALMPTVAVVNNGPHKGGGADGFDVVQNTPGVEAIWQLHRALDTDEDHSAAEQMTANPTDEDECLGYWIKASVQPDGRSYIITNGRNQFTRTYAAR